MKPCRPALNILLTLLLTFLAASGAAAGDPIPAIGLPRALQDLWQGGDRCGEPTAEQSVWTLELDPQLAAEMVSQAKVIPYRFILEDLVADIGTSAGSDNGRAGASSRPTSKSPKDTGVGSGLIYMKGRYSDPETGRFLSPDPFAGSLVEPPSLHPYNYAYGNPTVYVDPDGRCVGALQRSDFCQAIARTFEFGLVGDPLAEAEKDIERREKVLRGRREFRLQTGREPLPDEVVWSEGSRALTASFQEIDMSGRVEADGVEWLVAGAGIGTRFAVQGARAAGASAGQQMIAGATQFGDEMVGELVGVSPGDVAGLARLARRGLAPRPPPSGSPSGVTFITESADELGVDHFSADSSSIWPPSAHGQIPGPQPPSGTPPVARLVEQPRDNLGRFVSKANPGLQAPGGSAVDDFERQARQHGFEVVGREVSVNTPFGRRRYDVVLRDPETGRAHGIEIKSSWSAFDRFDQPARQQSAADQWLNQVGGANAVGRYEDLYIDSVVKVLWELK